MICKNIRDADEAREISIDLRENSGEDIGGRSIKELEDLPKSMNEEINDRRRGEWDKIVVVVALGTYFSLATILGIKCDEWVYTFINM